MAEVELKENLDSLSIESRKRKNIDGLEAPNTTIKQTENSSDVQIQTSLRRSTRKRIKSEDSEKQTKANETFDKPSTSQDIEEYYLDRGVKRLPPSLETIFEEPQLVKNKLSTMSSRKFKRVINFSETVTNLQQKLKKRQMKLTKLCCKRRRQKKVSMDFLLTKLSCLDE